MDIRERVARAIARAIERKFNDDIPYYASEDDWPEWLGEADAAISAVIEEVALIAERWKPDRK